MATTINKHRVLTQFFQLLKDHNEEPQGAALPVLEQFLYGICREGATREAADRAFAALRSRFFDWNEVRVSSRAEVEEALGDLPNVEQRAQRILDFLQEVFETTFSFDLEGLHKKGIKQAAKTLTRYQAARDDDFICSWVTQRTLGGHAIPLDGPTLRVCERLGLIESEQEDREAVRTSLEHLIPKAKGPHFTELVSRVAQDYCWEFEPNCRACPLRSECMTGQEAVEAVPARGSSRKPR